MEKWEMPGKPALVLMHMQNGLAGSMTMMPNWSSDAAMAISESGMLDRIQELLAAFREKQLPICFVNAHSTGAMATVPKFGQIYQEMRASRLDMDILHDEQLRHNLDVMPEMNRRPDEGLLINWNLGAFTMSGLDIWLRLRGVDTIIFCGFAGHSVVYTSTLQACDLWYNVVIPRDATCVVVPRVTVPEGWTMEEADTTVEKVTFDILAPIYSLVTNSADVIAHL
jgi:nicotinamidase-related amidase